MQDISPLIAELWKSCPFSGVKELQRSAKLQGRRCRLCPLWSKVLVMLQEELSGGEVVRKLPQEKGFKN